MGLEITRALRPAAAVAAGLVAVLLAGCTSSDGDGPSSAPASSSAGPTTSTPTATSSAPTTGTSSPAGSGLAALDGGYLLAGTDPDTAKLYRVTGGRVVAATEATGIGSVTVGESAVVVGRDTGSAETVEQLRGGGLRSLGIRSGFAPALSDDGDLAYAVLGAGSTPGISKPGGVSLRVRTGLTGRDRVLRTFGAGDSILALTWTDDDLVAAVSDGERGRLLVFPDGRGPAKGLVPAILSAAADTATLVGRDDAVALSGDDGATPAQVVSLPDGRPRDVAAGWQPVCFADDDLLVVARGARLATVAVPRSGELGTPRPVGSAPAPVQGGACA